MTPTLIRRVSVEALDIPLHEPFGIAGGAQERAANLLVTVELLRAVALATVLAGLLSGLTALVFVAIAVSGLLGAISPVAVSALIPRLVPAAELPSANGLNGVIESTAMATGAVAGGVLLALVGIGPALALDLLTFLLAAWLFAGRRLFHGRAAVVACRESDAFVRALLLHGLSIGLDASPEAVDSLVVEGGDILDVDASAIRPKQPGCPSQLQPV